MLRHSPFERTKQVTFELKGLSVMLAMPCIGSIMQWSTINTMRLRINIRTPFNKCLNHIFAPFFCCPMKKGPIIIKTKCVYVCAMLNQQTNNIKILGL